MENTQHNFQQVEFYTTVNDLEHLPLSDGEIAIVGRSNCGKSTLLNMITRQNRLAYTSKTPGRTQHINYFKLKEYEKVFLVDLPGYGYAKVPESVRLHWRNLLGKYLQNRKPLIGLILIMDIRHPLKDSDYMMLDFFESTNKPIHIVLSKADKLNISSKTSTLKQTQQKLIEEGLNNFSIQIFSSLKNIGVDTLEQTLNEWITKYKL